MTQCTQHLCDQKRFTKRIAEISPSWKYSCRLVILIIRDDYNQMIKKYWMCMHLHNVHVCSFVYASEGNISKYFPNITKIFICGSGRSWHQEKKKESSRGENKFSLEAQCDI